MPGYANWQGLYKLEYGQLYEEGYPVGDTPLPDLAAAYLPDDLRGRAEESLTEADWQRAYHALWQVRAQGLRPDYPFVEPDDLESIIADAAPVPVLTPLSPSEYQERVKGAWFGRCAAVILGKPFEMHIDRQYIKRYLESVDAYPLNDWVPGRSEKLGMTLRNPASTRGHVQYAEPDDDIHYTILGLILVEKYGLKFSQYDVGKNIVDNIPYNWLWSCTKQAYYHWVNMTDDRPAAEQVAEFPLKLNPWREGINAAIRADFWGYISPGDPRRAGRIAFQEVTFNTTKNGTYSSMFVAGCLAAALSQHPTVETILQGGLSVIPKRSRMAAITHEVMDWYAEDGDWISVCDRIYEKYGHLPFLATLHNMAFVVLALIHGQLDYEKSITTAVMCGMDTDCTSGTAGSIVAAALGYEALPQKWIAPLNDYTKTVVADFREGSISGLVDRTVAVWQNTRDQQPG
ncbi:MAG: ADP-ribosylglycohydrolase family protein [Anaerolineae bacterium]|nr:ADP-ribosylglycohydrolase family protein [Anaerolineae bacterium]